MIGSALSRLDTAEKLSIPQLQQAIKSGTIPAYMGVPLLEEKIAFEQRMRSAAAARMAQGQQPTIAEQVMDQAQMADQQMMDEGGIDQLPIEAPEFAGGGIVAFEDGGQVERFQNQGLVEDDMIEQAIADMVQRDPSFNPNFLRNAIAQASPERRKQLIAQLTDRETRKFARQGQGVPGTQAGITAIDTGREDSKFARQGVGVPGAIPPPKDLGIAPDMTEPAIPPSRGINSIVGEATRLTDALGFGPRPDDVVPTIEQAGQQTSELLERSGYDEGLLKRMGQDISGQRESLAKDRTEARNFRLLEAGLGIMAGTSPNAFENIGKGATPALRNLASDIKEIKKAEREYQLAEQNLLLKQNEAAMGKAKITQGTIDKAQERLDKRAENRDRAIANLTNTMLSGEIQKDVARSTVGARMTDFDKKWSLATDWAKKNNVPLTPQLFAQLWSVGAGTMTREEAVTKVLSTDYGKQLDLSDPKDRQKLQEQVDYLLGVGSPRAASSTTGKPPALPPGFVLQQ